MSPQPNLSAFIWSVADLLRGDFKAHEYGRVILPFTVLRRLDCVLEPTRAQVLSIVPNILRFIERRRSALVPLTLNVSAISLLQKTIKAQRRQGSGSGRPAD